MSYFRTTTGTHIPHNLTIHKIGNQFYNQLILNYVATTYQGTIIAIRKYAE